MPSAKHPHVTVTNWIEGSNSPEVVPSLMCRLLVSLVGNRVYYSVMVAGERSYMAVTANQSRSAGILGEFR